VGRVAGACIRRRAHQPHGERQEGRRPLPAPHRRRSGGEGRRASICRSRSC
jgi:hypothetical protein